MVEPVTETGNLFDDVLQLTNVARPSVAHQRAHRLVVHGQGQTGFVEEVFHQERNVFFTFPKRRHDNLNDPEAIEQVFPELAGGDTLREIAVGDRHDSDVHRLRL